MISKSKRCVGFILVLWLPSTFYAFSQISWWHAMGSNGSRENAEQHVVHHDHIFVCGYFEHSIVLGNVTLTSRGESDIYLYKAKSDGTILWAKSLGGSSYDGDVGLGIDPDGNVYLAGGFINQLYLSNSVVLNAGNSYWNSFFSKFDGNGNLVWIKGILAESQYSEVRVWGNISVNSNSFVVAATYSGSISVDGLYIPGSTSQSYLLIAKFDHSGNLIWSKIPTGARDCSKIHLDDEDAVYFSGAFNGTMTFDSHSLVGNSDYSDVYLAKLDQAGHTQWLKGGIKTTSRIDNNWSTSFTVDPEGGVYLIGIFKGDVAFDHLLVHGNTNPEYSVVDTFVAKYDADGRVVFVVNFGPSYHAFGTDIVYSSFGLFVLGMSAGSGQYFISAMDPQAPENSVPQYIEAFGIPLQLSVIDDEKFYVSGLATRVQDQNAGGFWDGVMIKVTVCFGPSNVSAIAGPTSLCPGDEVTFSVELVEDAEHFVWRIPPVFTPHGKISTTENEVTLKVNVAGSGIVSVYAKNTCNKSRNTSTVNITIVDPPSTPIITKEACDVGLTVSHGENIRWFRNNELIEGADDKKIIVSDSGIYKVKIQNFCGSKESIELSMSPIQGQEKPFFPNVITPNNDHKNDFFHLDRSLLDSRLKIFNRWGNIVYESDSYDNSWDGKNIPSGVYFYYLEHRCFSKPFKGNIHVIK